jgi:hypothetical protein
MKIISLFLASFFFFFICHAQNEYYNAKSDCNLVCELGKSYKTHMADFSRQSLVTTVFVKFDVDSFGHIINIEVSAETPSLIASFAREAIQSTDGNWLPLRINGKSLPKTTFLLPIVVNLQAGAVNDTTKRYNVLGGVSNMLHFGNNITDDRLHFGGPITQSLNCIILNPYHLESVM